MTEKSATPVLVLLSAILLSGCHLLQEAPDALAPDAADDFAREFVWTVVLGQTGAAEELLVDEMRNDETRAVLRRIHRVLGRREPGGMTLVGYRRRTTDDGTAQRFTYQTSYEGEWVLTRVTLRGEAGGGDYRVSGIRFDPIPGPLEEVHAFTLADRSGLHYGMLGGAVAVPLLILWAIVACARSDAERKWLWLVFIALGVGKVGIDWTSGTLSVNPLSFQLLGASAFRDGFYGAWNVAVSLPLGALVFLVRRPGSGEGEGPSGRIRSAVDLKDPGGGAASGDAG